ncbi:hypothetical protein T484DRAFT_1745074 [Baffinella frigidus]|nr:hypothetical protein T484DRAFT_1745074 [Cryptophyta sp. CCMP2293]
MVSSAACLGLGCVGHLFSGCSTHGALCSAPCTIIDHLVGHVPPVAEPCSPHLRRVANPPPDTSSPPTLRQDPMRLGGHPTAAPVQLFLRGGRQHFARRKNAQEGVALPGQDGDGEHLGGDGEHVAHPDEAEEDGLADQEWEEERHESLLANVERSPHDPDALGDLAEFQWETLRDLDGAEETLRQSLASNPRDIPTMEELAAFLTEASFTHPRCQARPHQV